MEGDRSKYTAGTTKKMESAFSSLREVQFASVYTEPVSAGHLRSVYGANAVSLTILPCYQQEV